MARPNFWEGNHPLCADKDRLYDELVPPQGNCPTLQGELLRAANRIEYDWYNNGWGCNNWSGAVRFIKKCIQYLPVQPSEVERDRLHKALREAAKYSHGEPVDDLTDPEAQDIVTDIMEIVVQAIVSNNEHIVNTRDMFDFQEKDYVERDSERW